MKKTIFAFFAFLAAPVVTAASISNDDYLYNQNDTQFDLIDASTFAEDGNFAVLIDIGTPLYQAGMVDFHFGFGEGEKDLPSTYIAFMSSPDTKVAWDEQFNIIDAPNGIFAVGLDGRQTITLGYETEIYASTLLFQIRGLFSDAPTASISYYEDATLHEIYSTSLTDKSLPSIVNVANLRIRSENLTMNDEQGVNITTWQGEVSAEDIKNPTYLEPTPSVPEPTTATLSLLALAGLSARRRR